MTAILDKEIAQGAKLEIEYNITLKNTSAERISKYSITDTVSKNMVFDVGRKAVN